MKKIGAEYIMSDFKCKWTVRSGNQNTFWAYTPCKKGFNYLSKVHNVSQIKSVYDGRRCPICGNVIECNVELLNEVRI